MTVFNIDGEYTPSKQDAENIRLAVETALALIIGGHSLPAGLCTLIDELVNSIDELAIVNIDFRGWAYFSGDNTYPVPGKGEGSDVYYSLMYLNGGINQHLKRDERFSDETIALNMYTGVQGALRIDLAKYLLDNLDNPRIINIPSFDYNCEELGFYTLKTSEFTHCGYTPIEE